MPSPLSAQKRKVAALRHRVIYHHKLGRPARRLVKAYHRAKARLVLLRKRYEGRAVRIAVKDARSHLGEVERYSNHISFATEFGIDGQPWCGAFVGHVLRRAGVNAPREIVYTPNILRLGWVRPSKPRPGDLVLFKWPGISHDPVDHVGLYVGRGATIEGNTSPGSGGSQNNGGGVYLRRRGTANVVGYVRPPYPR